MSLRTSIRVLGALVIAGAISAGPAAADVDTTPPEITITTPTEGQVFASAQGGVPTGFSCADEPGGSGLATCVGDATLDTNLLGDRQFTVHTTDNAGNAAEKTINYRVVDMIPPQITITAPVAGQHVPLHSTFSSAFDCTDTGGSGIDTCRGTQIIESPEPGPHEFTVLAIDRDGNRVTKSVPYVVDATEGGSTRPDVNQAAGPALSASVTAVKSLRSKRTATLSITATAGAKVQVRVTAAVKGRTKTVAKAAGVTAGNGTAILTLKPTGAAGRKVLRGRKKVRLHVFVTITDAQGRTSRADKVITARR